MTWLQRKLMFGLGLSAAVSDADGAGYLGVHEATDAQQLRLEYGAWCAGLAAEYLHRHRDPVLARQAIRSDFEAAALSTDTGSFTYEEAALVNHFTTEMDTAIDRLAGQSAWRLQFELLGFRTPRFIKVLIAVAIVTGLAVLILRMLEA